MKKRLMSILLVLAILLSAVPAQTLAAEASGATITVSRYTQLYTVVDGTVYYINRSGVLEHMDGTTAYFAPGTYTLYYGPGGLQRQMDKTVYSGTVTVAEGATNASVSLESKRFSQFANSDGSLSTAQNYLAKSIYYNTSSFDHIHIRVEGSYVIHVNGTEYTARVSDPTMVVRVNGSQVISHSWTGTTNYEWTYNCNIARSSLIEVDLTLDLTYTDADGEKVVMEDVNVVYDNNKHLDKFIEAIAICDAIQGLDFTVAVEDIEEVIVYHTVTYQWKVYGPNGELMDLPAGAPFAPSATSGHESGTEYVYDTEYVTGTSFYDYENGLLYSFHGWDTYSHSQEFNVNPQARGMTGLDDGDAVAENNKTVPISADTYINGYWTVSELPPASAYIVIDKVFVGDANAEAAAGELWFRIDTGYDGDGDGATTVDVDYPQIVAAKQTATGEYRLPVYQYDTPFTITEYNADVPGYTRVTSIAVTGTNASGSASGDTVTVTLEPEYEGENVKLATVTYTNTYTKKEGEPVSLWPSLTLMKTATDTERNQDGVVFTLYADAACTQALTELTTADGGLAFLDFSALKGVKAGTYYLKETTPLTGYNADPHVFALTVTASDPVEELRDGLFIQVIRHSLTVTVEEDCYAVYNGTLNRLHVYNDPILGSLKLNKETTGLPEADKASLNAVVIVHGPITRNDSGAITGIGSTWELNLNAANGWAEELGELPLGEYLIHESLASVHGYTWTKVAYGDLPTEVYNGITSGVFTVSSDAAVTLTLTNAYEQWNVGDFYIKKVNEQGEALEGAVFQIFQMTEDGLATIDSEEFTITATTGADGYAHFTGFTVPEGQASVTYYLREVKAPAGYRLSDTVYQVDLKAITLNGKTSYEPKISLQDASGAWSAAENFQASIDLLTVTNTPVAGMLTLTKTFANGLVPQGLSSISVLVEGPGGFSRVVTLSSDNSWSAVLTDLALGTYTVVEQNSQVPGYSLVTSYQVGDTTSKTNGVVTLAETNPGFSDAMEVASAHVTITNTYTRNEETYEIPATLTVRKVASDGTTPLAGAEFTMDRYDRAGKKIYTISFVSNEEGVVVFDLLAGFIVDGESLDGTYRLYESKAPQGYAKTDLVWTVTVTEDDGELRVELNAERNVFENFWDWAVGGVDAKQNAVWSFEDAVLTVENAKLIDVSVTKEWIASEGVVHPEAVEAVLYRNGEAYDTVTLNAENKWSHTWKDLTDDFTWTVDEKAVPAGYEKTVTNDGYAFTITNSKIFKAVEISVEKVWIGEEGTVPPDAVEAVLYRNGEVFDTVKLNAANGWGHVWTDLTDEFTWTVDEPSVPSGYSKEVEREGNHFTITNMHLDIPRTGDDANFVLWSAMLTLGLLGACWSLVLLNKPRRRNTR